MAPRAQTTGLTFSVVIPTFNRMQTLRQTLGAVTAQTLSAAEIIVVDDGSTDDTGTQITREFPTARYLPQTNAGPATARNRGIGAACGNVIAFTDDDCLPPSNWLERLADGFTRHPEVTGVGGSLLAASEVRATNLLARYEAYIVRDLYRARDEEIVAGFDCPAGGTNNMAYRRDALQAMNGFDTSFPYPAAEDADLKWRLARSGARFLYMPVTVTHLQSYTWEAFRQQQFVRGKGRIYFDRKWHRRPSAARVLLRFAYGVMRLAVRIPSLPEKAFLRPAFSELWNSTRGGLAALTELKP
jgi:glycosyltransferase involved in cell wall biosynthesis